MSLFLLNGIITHHHKFGTFFFFNALYHDVQICVENVSLPITHKKKKTIRLLTSK